VDYEDRITIDTPEGVALELTLAGLGSRAIAGGIDILLKLALGVAELVLLVALFGDTGWLAIVPVAGLSFLVYNVAFEVLGGGRTPGKRMSGLRVVRCSGRPVDFRASMIRNVVRLVDGVTFTYLPTMVSIVATRRNQRLGDLAADTVVIRERRGTDRVQTAPAPAPVAMSSAGTALTSHVAPGPAWPGSGARVATGAGAGAVWTRSVSRRSRITTVSAARSPRRWLRRVATIETIVGR